MKIKIKKSWLLQAVKFSQASGRLGAPLKNVQFLMLYLAIKPIRAFKQLRDSVSQYDNGPRPFAYKNIKIYGQPPKYEADRGSGRLKLRIENQFVERMGQSKYMLTVKGAQYVKDNLLDKKSIVQPYVRKETSQTRS